MRQTLRVRPARPDDAPTIVEFQQAMARETEGRTLPEEVVTTGVRSLMAMPEAGFYARCPRRSTGSRTWTAASQGWS